LLAEHGFIRGARVHFRYALKLNPEDVEAHCEYARLLARFGHRHEAEVQYKKPLSLTRAFRNPARIRRFAKRKRAVCRRRRNLQAG